MNKLTFKNILYLSILIHIVTSYFSSGFHHYDEHFQIIEFMNYKLGGIKSASLTWEYGLMMRPWFQISIYYFFTKILTFIGITSPFKIVFVLRLITSLFGVFALYKLIPLIKKWLPKYSHQILLWTLLNFLWFIPFIQSRTSSESLSISFFLLGFSFFIQLTDSSNDDSIISSYSFYSFINFKKILKPLIPGLLLGAAYLVRPQIALMVAPLWFWAIFIKKTTYKNLLLTALSIIIMIILGTVFDYWGYGKWTFISWNYYTGNFNTGVMAHVKHYPWHYFLKLTFLRGIPFISFPLMASTIYGLYKYWRHPITWVIIPLAIFHSAIGHKELRYIFPIIILTPFYFTFFIRDFQNHIFYSSLINKTWFKIITKFTIGLNVIMLIFMMLKPANPAINFFKYLYNNKQIKKLYYFDGNPYHMLGTPLSFYIRPDLNVRKANDYEKLINQSITNKTTIYLFFDKSIRIFEMKKHKNCKLQYLTYPEWVLKINIANWVKRSRIWSMYKCNNE